MILIPVRFGKPRVNISLFLVPVHLRKQNGCDVALPSHDTLELERRKLEEKRLSSKEVRKIQQEIW